MSEEDGLTPFPKSEDLNYFPDSQILLELRTNEDVVYATHLIQINQLFQIWRDHCYNAEEVVRRCSSKTLFLKTCNIHRKGPLLKDLSNKETFPNTGIFLWILQNFYKQRFFIEHLWWLLLSMIKVCSIPLWMTNEWQINNNNHYNAWTILFSNKTKFKWNCKLLWWFSKLLLVSWNMIIIFVEKLT